MVSFNDFMETNYDHLRGILVREWRQRVYIVHIRVMTECHRETLKMRKSNLKMAMIHTFIFTYFGLKYSQHLSCQLAIIRTWNIRLKTNIATVRFRRDVNCVEPACIEAIHGIATRIEEIIVYLRIGVDCSNSRVNLWMRGGKAVIKLYRNREVRARLVWP